MGFEYLQIGNPLFEELGTEEGSTFRPFRTIDTKDAVSKELRHSVKRTEGEVKKERGIPHSTTHKIIGPCRNLEIVSREVPWYSRGQGSYKFSLQAIELRR